MFDSILLFGRTCVFVYNLRMAITQSTILPLEYGEFEVTYHKYPEGACIALAHGDITTGTPIVRLHSSCLFGEAFHALDCECAQQLAATLKMIRDDKYGIIAYEYAEGRGIGLEEKIKALEIQRTTGKDTVEAFTAMGLKPDLRTYELSVRALKELKTSRTIKLATQNPRKIASLENAGFEIIEIVPPKVVVTPFNKPELVAKKLKLGHMIDVV